MGLILKIAAGIILAVIVLALLVDAQVTTRLDDTTPERQRLDLGRGSEVRRFDDVLADRRDTA